MRIISTVIFLFSPLMVHAQLALTISPPKVASNKAVVKLGLTNNLPEKIESARAVVFLLDDQGRMVGQKTDWIVGGTKDSPSLEPGKGTDFNFVVTTIHPLTATNLTTRVTVTRILLEDGKVADVNKDVTIQNQ